jgi:hypothetical protein
MHHISSVADRYFWLYEWFCDEGVDEKLKKIFELHQLSMAHFVDFDEINKKVMRATFQDHSFAVLGAPKGLK